MEKSILDNNSSMTQILANGIRRVEDSTRPIAAINTEYDRELNQTPIDDYEALYNMTKDHPEDTLKEYNWLDDATTTFMNQWDNIDIMTAGGELVKDVNPTINDINFELSYLQDVQRVRELDNTLNSLDQNSNDYRRLLTERNLLADSLRARKPQYDQLLVKYDEVGRDEDVSSRIDELNESLTSFENRRTELEDRISSLRESIEERGRASADYRLKEQRSQDASLTDSDYWKYTVPGMAGSSAQSLVTNAQEVAGALTLWLGKKGAMSLFGGPVGTGAAVVSGVFDLAQVANSIYNNLQGRSKESYAQVYGAYKDRIDQELQNQGIDKQAYISAARQQMLEANPNIDPAKLDDDQVMDAILLGKVNVDDEVLSGIKASSANGLQEVYNNNMALSAIDIAQSALTIAPVGNAIKGLITNPIGKAVSKVGTNTAIGRTINNTIDKYTAFNARMTHQSPKKFAALQSAKALARLGFAAVGEGFEEGNQDIFDYDYAKAHYDDNSTNLLTSLSNLVDANYRTAKILSGIDTESELANDPQFWNDVKGGFALGLFMGGVNTAITETPGIYKEMRANTFVRDMVLDQINKKDRMAKTKLYADKAANTRLNYTQEILDSIERYKAYKPDGITDADVDAEKEAASRAMNLTRSKINKNIAKAANIPYGSEDYSTLIGLQTLADEDYQEAVENARTAENATNQFTDTLISNQAIQSLPADQQATAASLTSINIMLEGVRRFREALQSDAPQGKAKFGITDKSNPIAKKLLADLDVAEKRLTDAANQTAEGTQFDAGYIADPSLVEQGASTYMNSLLAEADLEVSQGKKNEMYGSMVVDGKLTNFDRLSDENKATAANRIKSRVARYNNDYTQTENTVNRNARDLVETQQPQQTQTTTEKQEETKSNIFNPQGQASVDTSIPTPPTATQGQTNRNLDTELNESLDPWGDAEKAENPVETQRELDDDIPLASTLEETPSKPVSEKDLKDMEEAYERFKKEREKIAEESKAKTESKPTESPTKEEAKETETKPVVASVDDDFSLYDVNDLDNAVTSSDGVYVDDAGEHFTQDKSTSNKTEEVAKEQTIDETEKQIAADLERAEALDKGLVNPLDDLPEFEGLGSFDKVSKTLFYNSKSDTPMLPGYKSGKELSKVLEQPGSLVNATYEFIINRDYTEKGQKPYVPGDRSTYNSASILLVITIGNDKYLMALKTPNGVRNILANLSEEERNAAVQNLTEYRNQIIEAIENKADNEKVVPQIIRRSNGVYNTNSRDENGVQKSVQRSIADIPALNDTDESNFGIGTGFTPDPVNRFVIFGHKGEIKPGHGGSGQLFIYPKPQYTLSGNPELPIQVNIKRFSKAQALAIAKMLKRYSNGAMAEQATPFGASAIELLHFVARFSPRTEIKSDDQRFGWLKEKQFFLDKNGNLHLGTRVYRNFSNATDEQVEEVARFIADTMHWRVDKTTFYGSINEAFPNSNFSRFFEEHPDLQQVEILPGVVVTRDQADRNISAMQWMKESGLLQSNLQDLLFTDPFMFAEGVAVEKTSEPVAPDNTPTNTSTFNDQVVNNTENLIVATTAEDEEETRRHIEENARQLDQGKFDILDWVDDLMDEPEGAPRRITREYKETITPEEIEWVKNKLGISSDQIEITENAIALGNDTYAMGLARAYSIVLWKAAERGTAYHEAFHRVSLLLLTPKERQRIYETYRNRNGYVGTDQMVEEELAEEFRQYMLNRTEPRLNIVRRMFNAIKNFISKWITHSDTTIDNIFDRIQSGYFKDSVLNKQSLEEFKQGYHNVGAPFKINGHELRTITNTQFNEVIDSLAAFAVQTANIQQFADVSSIDLTALKDKFNPDTVDKAVASGRLTQSQGNIWKEIYERFDDVFVPSITTKLKNYQLDGVRKQENIDAELDAKQDADGGAVADQMAQYTYDALEVSAKDNALTSVKIFIATLPAAKFDENGKLVPIRSAVTGLPLTVKYDEAMNSALNELNECNTFDDLLKRTYELGKTVPTFKILNNKLRKLTAPVEGETDAQKIAKENLQTQIRNTFRKAKHAIIGVLSGIERMVNGDALSTMLVRNESSGKDIANQIVGFTNELIRNSKLLSFDDNRYSITKEGEQTIDKIQSNLSKLKAFVNKNRNTNPKAISDSIPRMKNIILAYLNEAGLKIDLDTLNSFISKNHSNPDPVEEFSKFITDNSRSGINYFFTNTLPALKSIQPSGKIVRTVNGKEYSVNLNNFYKNNTFVKGIAEAYVLVNPNPTELSVLASDGKLLYPISDHNYLSDMTQKLDRNDKIVTDLTRVTYVAGSNSKPNYCKGSTILTELLNSPSGRGKIDVKTFAYFKQSKSRDRGRKYMEVSPLEDYIMKMALTQQGHMLLPTMGDSGTYNTLYGSAIKNFAKPLTIRKAEDGSMSISFSAEVLDRMINYFETELDTIKQNYANEDFVDSHPERKIKNYHTGARNGYRFRYFGGFFKINGKDGDLNTFNDALKLAEEADKEQGTHENVQNVLNQITSDWNKHSTTEKYAMMNSMLMEVFKGELNYAQELSVITWDGKKFASIKNQAIPQRSLSEAASHYEGLGLNMEQERALGATELLANYFANSIWNVIEFEKLYVKDPAYYKNPVDKIKRLREALSTGVTPRLDYPEGHPLAGITEVNVGMLSDNKIVSREIKKINSKAKDAIMIQLLQTMQNMSEADAVAMVKAKTVPVEVSDAADIIVKQKFEGYTDVNQTDATVLISPDMYQQLVRRIDGWTPEVQRAFEVLNDPNADYSSDPDLYNEALAVTLKPLKFMYFGDHFDAELGLDIPIFDKMAMFPVHRIFSTGDAKAIYDVMTNPDKPIHMLAFDSAVKVGQYMNAPSIYTDKTNTEINVEGLGSIVTHKQSLANFRRQLITDPHHASTQMFVSQAQKAATGNIRKNNTYTTPSGESLTGQELIDAVRNTMNALTLKGRESVEQRFNITTDEDGVSTADSATFASVIQRDAIQSGMNQNVIEGLQARREGGTVAPISGLSDNTWIESRLISLLNKDIIDNNLPGGMFIQMSSILYNKLVVNTDKEQQRKLNYCNDDGSMDAVISINLLKHFIPDYEHKTFKEAKDWLLKNKVIGPDSGILAMGYRIPAQGQSSTVALKIVDIYPEQIGDTITLPDEFTALTGSDFDIDKLFIARYHYDSKGNKIQFETRQQYENRLRELGFDDETIARYSYNRYNGKSDYEANTKEALENRLLDMYLAVLTNANTFNEVRQPLDTVTDYLKNHILSVVDSLTQQSKASTSSPLYYVTPQFQSKTKAELSGGKRGIGPFALAASHHALTQQVGLTLANNKGSEILQRFGITNVSGIRSNQNNHAPGFEQVNTNILDWLSAMINAHVDVAKDPYIIRLNVRSLTYNMTNFLLRTGVGETTFYFLPQQILKDFAVEYDKYAGFYGVDLPAYANPESTAHRNVWNKYFEAANKLATTSEQKKKLADLKKNPSAFLSSELLDINWLMKQLNVKDEAYKSFNWYFNQLRVMKLYDAFTPASRSLSALTTLSQIDTKKFGNNFGLESAFLVRWKNFVQTDGTFNNPLSMFTNTFLYQKLVNGMLFPRDAFKNVMLRLTPQFEIWRNKLHALTGTLGSSNNDTINGITRAMEAQYKSAFFDKYCKDHSINIDDLLYGKNSIVNRFYTLRNRIIRGEYSALLDSTGRLENALLNSLVPRQKYDSLDAILPDFFELKFNKDSNDGMDDILIRAWEELSDSEYADVREFARDLAIYSFYTSGDAFGRNNFFKYVPNSLRESLGYFDYIRNLESDPDNLSQFAQLTNPIFRNLWWNEDIVPTVEYIKPSMEFDKATGEVYQTDGKLPNQESGYTIQTDDGKYLDVPGIFMNTRRPRTIGFNEQGDTIYTPYVKIRLNGDLDPRYTMLYRFIGVAKDSQGNVEYPVYRLIPKFGVNMQGMTLLEFGKQTSSIGANNYYYKGSVDPTIFTDYRPIKDIAPTSLKTQVDVFNFLKDINTNSQQLASEQQSLNESTTTQPETTEVQDQSTDPTQALAEEWSKKEGWSVEYFNKNVLPKLDQAWQMEFELAPDQSVKPSFKGFMTFSYGDNARSDISSTSTLEAVRNSERTATTRYTKDGNISYWKQAKVGDVVEFTDNEESVKVVITKPLTKLVNPATQSEEVVQTTNDFDEFVRETSEHSNTAILDQVREQIPQAVQLQKTKEDNGYTFTFGNDFEVSLPFTLNEQQEAALRELEAFVNDPVSSQFTLSGYAGTGKTTVIGIFKQYLDDINQKVIFTAPTHRANSVTRAKTPGATVMTLAKLFGLSVDVDLSSNSYDLRTLQARQTNDPKLEGGELIIIDEASMVQDGMYELIQNQLATYPGTKVIYVGDQGQLRPVKSDTISKVFTDADTPKMQLTKVERTGDNPILKESTRLRNGEGFSYETELVNGEGVTFTNDRTQIATWVKNALQSTNFAANKTYFKIVAGTNAAVEAWNRYARKVLFGNTEHYLTKGDLITGYNNALRDRFGEYQFVNSMDYVVTAVRPTSLKYSLDGETVTLRALDVTLQNASDSSVNPIRMSFAVPGQTQILTKMREYIDDLWSVYRTAKARGDRQSARFALQKINSITESLFLLENVKDSNGRLLFQKTADYGYAVTAHKSQGGTFNKVLVDEKSINAFRNAELEKELKYVAVSRASEDVMVIADKTYIESPITNKPMSNDFSSADQMASDEANALRGIQPNAEASARFQQSLANLGLTEEDINELSNLGTQRKKECE